jgi:hypothetical protein
MAMNPWRNVSGKGIKVGKRKGVKTMGKGRQHRPRGGKQSIMTVHRQLEKEAVKREAKERREQE